MEQAVCKKCGTGFERLSGLSKPRLYCSKKCKTLAWYTEHKDALNARRKQVERVQKKRRAVCPVCRVRFETTDARRKFCETHCKQSVRDYRRNLKQRAVNYKGGKCQECGYNRYSGALKFHHLDPEEKDFEISKGGALSWGRIEAELNKCIMVCGNCHDEIHAGLRMVA